MPVIYLTGRVDPKEAVTYTHQVFDHAALLRPITKASLEVTDGAVEEIIDKAVAIAMDEPYGLKESWLHTKGQGFRLLGTLILTAMPVIARAS